MTYEARKLEFTTDGDHWTDTDEDGYQSWRITGPDGYDKTYPLRSDIADQWIAQELDILRRMDEADGKLCPHGLSLALCDGPQHYPMDTPDDY